MEYKSLGPLDWCTEGVSGMRTASLYVYTPPGWQMGQEKKVKEKVLCFSLNFRSITVALPWFFHYCIYKPWSVSMFHARSERKCPSFPIYFTLIICITESGVQFAAMSIVPHPTHTSPKSCAPSLKELGCIVWQFDTLLWSAIFLRSSQDWLKNAPRMPDFMIDTMYHNKWH